MTERRQSALTDVVCVRASSLASKVGDELAVLDLDRSVYYGLDPVGARIWELLQTPTVLSTVVATLIIEFDVDDDTARRDLLGLIDELMAKQLVERRASDAS